MKGVIPAEVMVDSAAALLADPQMQPALTAAHETRVQAAAALGSDLRRMAPYLPELPDSQVAEVYEGVVTCERRVAPQLREADYREGTASAPDDIVRSGEQRGVLFEAGHSTDPASRKDVSLGGADHGTAGITGLLVVRGLGRGLIMSGRQTGNSNTTPNHPLHAALAEEVATRSYDGFVSVHGMRPGKVTSLLDETEIHAVIGLGLEPNEASEVAAERLIEQAAAYGLRVVVGNHTPHMNFAPQEGGARVFPGYTDQVKLDAAGKPGLTRLAALGDNFTTTVVSRLPDAPPARMQLEISRRLRLLPLEYARPADPAAERMCVYLGYRLVELAAENSAAVLS